MTARLTLARVEQCLQQGKAEAQRLGVQAAIVVVDAAGHLVGALRFEDALWVTPEIARAKANAACAFRNAAHKSQTPLPFLLFLPSPLPMSPPPLLASVKLGWLWQRCCDVWQIR
jgi:hypothetical protein